MDISSLNMRLRMDMAKKGNLKRKTEYLLIATQNKTKRASYIKAKILNTQQNSKCR